MLQDYVAPVTFMLQFLNQAAGAGGKRSPTYKNKDLEGINVMERKVFLEKFCGS